jgi:hypothetical protein
MTDKIAAPGRYQLTNAEYHGNCTVGPALSASGARILIEQCPAAFWWNSPLNPAYVPEQSTTFDLGTAAHAALLEPGSWLERVVIVEADDYKTKAAQQARDAAWAAGKVPLLPKHFDRVEAMRAALLAHPLARLAWSDGAAEQSYIWHDKVMGTWLKARPDFVPDHGRWIVDYKTTTSAHPRAFTRKVFEMGYFQQAAWYLDGIEAVTGKAPSDFFFVAQETAPPYLVSVCKLDQRAVDWGRTLNRRAINLFAECVAANRWPGYAERATTISLPSYAEFQLEERKEMGEFASEEKKRLAREFFAP